jgi:integrase
LNKSNKLSIEIFQYYLKRGIITLDDVISLSQEDIMLKILKEVHPYSVFYSESDNRWHTTIADNTKVNGRRPVARKSKLDLEKFLLENYQLDLDPEIQEASKTFKEIFEIVEKTKLQYIKTPEKLISAKNTAIKTDSEYRRFFAGTDFENLPINKITKEDIENVCLVNLQKYDLKKKAFLSLRGILKSVFDLAFSEYWITDNVYQRVIFKKFNDMLIPDTPTHKRVHSQKEFSDILKELHRKQKARPKFTTYWALELQMIMGLRRGEIPPLRWKKDVTETFVSIAREQLTADNEYIIVEHTKNHKDRFFPITNDLEEFFIRLKSMHEKYYPDSEFLFPADTPSGCITNNAVYKVYQGICKSLGIEIVKDEIKGPHSFRRNAITEVVNSTNGNVVLASALFGNSPQVAKENYYTGANLAIAKEILDKRVLIQK